MYYLSADGGGTKLSTLLFDDQLRLIASGRAAGTNATFRPPEDVRADMARAIEACLGANPPEIEHARCTIVGPTDEFIACLRRKTTVRAVSSPSEGALALAAGAGVPYGVLALCGTGSDVFLVQPDVHDTIGGWGTILGDEGSGYDIGVSALRAAIYAEDGSGEPTMLLPMIYEEWRLQKLWGMVPLVYGSSDPRRLVASVTQLVSRAAAAGDPVALSLYRKAAHEMAHMTICLLQRHDGRFEGPVVVSGGVWKGSPAMFDCFRREVLAVFPDAEVLMPVFEPVVGGVVLQAFENGMQKADFWSSLQRDYHHYRYLLTSGC